MTGWVKAYRPLDKAMKRVAVVLAGSLLSCHGSAEPAAQPTRARPVFSSCLLGNADIEMTRHRYTPAGGGAGPVTEDGSCIIGTSCIEEQGQESPGDGRVGLTCKGGQCVCHFEQLVPPGASWDESFAATCMTSERAEELMLAHCLKDMHLASTEGL